MLGQYKVISLMDAKALSGAGSTNGTAVNLKTEKVSTRRKSKMVVSVGELGGTSPTVTVKLQGSADGTSNWTDISGATTTAISSAGAVEVYVDLPYPFVRSVVTLGGTSPTASVYAGILAGLISV